ncbi:WD40 repeat-like protein [Astrocystis sublimbata]|nr:WD40 repeat-like protein [Astrocystis sublimbata]
MDPKPRRSSQTTVEVNYMEPSASKPHSRIKLQVAECIETKTVTTTTTTKRSYPPMNIRSRPLRSLDAREFPLARKATPPELAHLAFSIDRSGDDAWSADQDDSNLLASQVSSSDGTLHADEDSVTDINAGGALDSSFTDSHASSKPPSPSYQASSRKALKMASMSGAHPATGAAKSVVRHNSRSQAASFPNAVADRLRSNQNYHLRLDRLLDNESDTTRRLSGGFPVTPDTTDQPPKLAKQSNTLRRSNLDSFETPQSESSQQQQSFFDISSPTGSDSHTAFSNVATPPITDADVEAESFVDADESLQQSIRAVQHPRPINTLVAQDASLPSPRLSPTLQASQLHTATDNEVALIEDDPSDLACELSRNQNIDEDEDLAVGLQALARYRASQASQQTLMDSCAMLESFDAMPSKMKSLMMFQFLRRCPRETLQIVAGVVDPALKYDILQYLPVELTLHILSFLDHRDLCRAAQVSKYWRGIIDCNETGWKELFHRDGFVLASGELQRAISEGWGWQDPVGPEGCELDLSTQKRLTSMENELHPKSELPLQKLRSSKRKRGLNAFNSDRSKRRASNIDNVKDDRKCMGSIMTSVSEGPITAALAAALAVPDPQIGLPSLKNLHLFKSIYRRHYMIRKSWTSGKVRPSHVAFAAHPRHVITCLQFDDDKIITGSDDMLIHVYDTKTGHERKSLEGHEGGVWALQYEGNVLVSGSTDRSVRVWDIEKGVCTQIFYGHTSTVRCLQILMPTTVRKDGRDVTMPAKPLIITGSRDSQLRVWRLPEPGSRRYIQTGPPANDSDCPYFIRTLQGHTHSVRAIAAHADTLVSGSYDNTVRVWRISTGQTLHVLQGHSQKVYSVVLDIERNRCISGSMDSFVKIWDLETGACLHTLEGHSVLVGLLDLRDQRLVSAAADSTLRIWDPETGRCQSTLTAHTGAITCFQHDGRKVISGSDRNLKMWDTRTGECLQDLLTDLSGVWQVRFDERRCVAAVQRDSLTYVEILDFGAVRDGKNPEDLGKRILLNPDDVQRIMEEDA